jgi:hypothetical protein
MILNYILDGDVNVFFRPPKYSYPCPFRTIRVFTHILFLQTILLLSGSGIYIEHNGLPYLSNFPNWISTILFNISSLKKSLARIAAAFSESRLACAKGGFISGESYPIILQLNFVRELYSSIDTHIVSPSYTFNTLHFIFFLGNINVGVFNIVLLVNARFTELTQPILYI